jgi:hypothetical protein
MGVKVSQKQDEPVLPNQRSLIHRTRQIHVNETKTKNREKESLRVKMPDKASYSKEKLCSQVSQEAHPSLRDLLQGAVKRITTQWQLISLLNPQECP